MKVKVTESIEVEVQVTQKSTCPAGTAYWQVDYMVDGLCIHSASTGAIYGNPDVIAMLDREYPIYEYHYQDVPDPDPVPTGDAAIGRNITQVTVGKGGKPSREAWCEETLLTHRQAIIDAYNQLII